VNLIRLIIGGGIVGACLYYFPVVDIAVQLLYLLIPLAVVFGLALSIAASMGLMEDIGLAQAVEAWVYGVQARYYLWREAQMEAFENATEVTPENP
jgi:hypothetical protein